MNMIVGDLTELYHEALVEGDILAEGADGGHDLIPTPITLRSIPLRSGFDCFEDDAGNLTYVAGEPGRADWIFPPKYQRKSWSQLTFISEASNAVWNGVSHPLLEKYPPDGWSSQYGYVDSGWPLTTVVVRTRHYYREWVERYGLDFMPFGSRTVMSSDFHDDFLGMTGWHRLMRRKFTVTVPSGMEIANAFLKVWSDNYSWWYLNGTEVAHYRRGASSGPFNIGQQLNVGNNLLSVQLANDSGTSNPIAIRYEIEITLKPTTILAEQFYAYWAQITGDPGDSPHNAFCIAGAHGISGHEYGNGARFYTYDHHHGKVNGVWINAFVLGKFE